MNMKHIIIAAVILTAIVSTAYAYGNDATISKCTNPDHHHDQVRVNEPHNLWKYHVALNHTKSNLTIPYPDDGEDD